MPFIKGVVTNPKGRLRTDPAARFNLKMACREHSEAALAKIVKFLDSKDEKVALIAAKEILDRAYGKPEQKADIEMVHRFAQVPAVMEKSQWLATRGDPKLIEHVAEEPKPKDPNSKLN
jgi:hypothetical protein